jgi:putative transposase
MACRVLGVSRSGYYDWQRRVDSPPVGRAAEDLTLLDQIRQVHAEFAYYGSPRIHQQLLVGQVPVGRRRVARLMRLDGIHARRGKIKTRGRSVPPKRRPDITDKVRRNFNTDVANTLWFTDITQIRTGEGWLYAAVILDSFNREIVSWATAGYDTPKTALQALADAAAVRRPPTGCIIHSDRGYQFTSKDWLDLAAAHQMTVSIGERRSCYDNAVMESWFASLKNEAIYPYGQPATKTQARQQLFHYIWEYNKLRLHSTLGYIAPQAMII